MKTIKPIKLIKGKFNKQDAGNILLGLINQKIQFNDIKNLNSQVTCGFEDSLASNRLKELNSSLKSLKELLSELEDDDQVEVHSEISITIHKLEGA